MGMTVGHVCGRRRGSSATYVGLRCDDDGCAVMTVCMSREEYDAALAAGWSVDPPIGSGQPKAVRTVRCPGHSGKTPTVAVQTELVL